MFDIGIDKLLIVGVLVGLILGPERLREWRRSIPRTIGRVHALYLQGKAQVVEDLNELAPDWREYDPRLLHPRRILRDLNDAAVQQNVEPDSDRMRSGVAAGASPGEESPSGADGHGSTDAAQGVREDVDRTARPPGQEYTLGDLDQKRDDPRDREEKPGTPGQDSREEHAEGDEEDDVEEEIDVDRCGSGHHAIEGLVDEAQVLLEVHRPEHDRAENDEVDAGRGAGENTRS